MRDVPIIPMGEDPGGSDAAGTPSLRPWQTARALSSARGARARLPDAAERFLGEAGFDRAPWLAVVFALGILAWFALPQLWQWCAAIAAGGGVALGAMALRFNQPVLASAFPVVVTALILKTSYDAWMR